MKIISTKILFITIIILTANIQLFAQCIIPWCTLGNTIGGTEVLGGNSSSIAPLQIHMDGPYSIEFYTTAVKNMELKATGDLNLVNFTNAYQLGDSNILWQSRVYNNLFVGTNAGNANGSTNNIHNTFVGNRAGLNNNDARDNTYLGTFTGLLGSQLYVSPAIEGTSFNTMIGSYAGLKNQSSHHTFVGFQAGYNQQATIPAPVGNTYIGSLSGWTGGLPATTGGPITNPGENVFVGFETGYYNTSSVNTFVGFQAGKGTAAGAALTTGSGGGNAFFGAGAGKKNIANFNTFIGNGSGEATNVTTAEFNTFVGAAAGANNTTGHDNCYIGAQSAGASSTPSSTGNYNNFMGSSAGAVEISGHDNEQIGYLSGTINKLGSKNVLIGSSTGAALGNVSANDNDNVFIGHQSGQSFLGGHHNTLLGSGTIVSSNKNNASAIGANAEVKNSNQMILGDNTVNVGIGLSSNTTGPQRKLDILDASNPQFRLSNVVNSKYTDFQTTSSGDLFIHPLSGGTDRKVGINTNSPAYTLFVNGDCGIFTMPTNTSNTNVVVWNSTTKQLELNSAVTSGIVTADNGATINGGVNNVQWGQDAFTLTNNGQLKHHTEIPMINPLDDREYNIYFSKQSLHQATPCDIGIGYPALTGTAITPLNAKIDVINIPSSSFVNQYTGRFINTGSYTATTSNMAGVYASSNVISGSSSSPFTNIGGDFYGERAYTTNYGVRGQATYSSSTATNYGVLGNSASAGLGYGVYGNSGRNKIGYGVYGKALSASIFGFSSTAGYGVFGESYSAYNNYGVYGKVDCISGIANYAVYGEVYQNKLTPCNASTITYAGYFKGAVQASSIYFPSDSLLKENIQILTGDSALYLINHLSPKTYLYKTTDYPSMGLPENSQYGLVAEDVSTVLPTLIKNAYNPPTFDSVGTIVDTGITFKALNYVEIIPILVAAVKQISTHPSTTDNGVSIGGTNAIEWGGTALKHHTEIPMLNPADNNEYNIYFTGQTAMQNAKADIGIGYTTSDNLQAKVDVLNTTEENGEFKLTNAYAGRFITDGSYRDGTAQDLVGVKGISSATKGDGGHNTNIGGDFYARNGITNIGVRGIIDGTYKPNTTNYAVYGEAMDTTNYWAGYFNGYIGTTAGWIQASDRSLKKDIKSMTAKSSMEILSKLKPSTYSFKTDGERTVNLPHEKQYGLIADEVKKQLPDLVRPMNIPAQKDNQGNIISPAKTFEGVNYTALIPLLISANQYSDSINQNQAKELADLKQQINELKNCCGYSSVTNPTNTGNTTSVELNDLAIMLDQNAPNPFAEQTIISYTIPETVKDAKIMFYTSNGIVMKEVVVSERGKSSMTVYASNLSAGIYSYSLIADGKMIDTKKMVCMKK